MKMDWNTKGIVGKKAYFFIFKCFTSLVKWVNQFQVPGVKKSGWVCGCLSKWVKGRGTNDWWGFHRFSNPLQTLLSKQMDEEGSLRGYVFLCLRFECNQFNLYHTIFGNTSPKQLFQKSIFPIIWWAVTKLHWIGQYFEACIHICNKVRVKTALWRCEASERAKIHQILN